MCSLRWKLVGAVCMTVGMFGSWAMGLDPGPVDLGAVSEPGLHGMFGQLELGPKEIDGIPFVVADARVRVPAGEKKRIDFPPVACAGLHFLHFTENAGNDIGSYALIYADGERVEIPLRSGLNIHDWWKPGPLAFAALVHSDILKHEDRDQPIGFWRFSVQNPRPDVPLAAIEIANTDASVTINLIAVTLTGTCGEKVGDVPVWVNGMDEEQFLLAVLNQGGGRDPAVPGAVTGKEKACEELKRVGTLKSVPALAACLGDEKLSHAARLALASMAYPEARAALRDALGSSTGAVKAGLIESIGTLRDPEDVPRIAPALRDRDPVVAMSAALALGRIGGPAAVDALKTSALDGSGRFRMVVLDALLRCAEALCGKDDAAANTLYTDIFKQWGRGYVGTAAYRGMIRTSGDKAQELISTALLGNDSALWDAALPAVREVGGAEVTKTCADLLGRVPRAVLPGLIGSLAQRGDKAAAPAIVPLVEDADPVLSAAAIKALALLGDGSSVAVLVKAAAHGEEPNRGAAMQALVQINAPDVSEALLAQLEAADPVETTVLAKIMGQRRDEAVAPALRKLIKSEHAGIRTAAAQALAEVGEATDAKLLCQAVEKAQDDKERSMARNALVVLGERLGAPAEFVNAVLACLNKDADQEIGVPRKDNLPLRCAMLSVCGRLRNADLLQALDKATAAATPEVKDAAIRAMADSVNPEALANLLNLLNTTTDLTQRVLVFRGIARLASNSKDIEEKTREEVLIRALGMAERPDEQKLLLGALGDCHTLGALKAVQTHLPSNDVVVEAVMAWGQIAKALLPISPDDVRNAAPSVMARAQEAGISKDAMRAVMDVVRSLAATPAPGDQVRFEHVVVDPQFRSEGVAVADVNRDGNNDILAGDLWYEAPDWKPHEIRPAQTYDGNTGYSRCFATFAADVDEDGWTDSIVIGMPGGPAYWYRNPGEGSGHWQEYILATAACNETPIYGDLLGDGKPVLMFGLNNRIAWFRTGQDKLAPWRVFPMSHQSDSFAQFQHGLGMGDVNGDGRMDILCTEGWWEGPVDRTRPDWGFHGDHLGPACANMLVYDVDGDGDNDVITSSAHEYGVWWFEQRKENDKTTFVQHEIDKSISQTHALILADINNDGLQDLITGKRYYAHCGHDPGCNEPAVLCWFELVRPEPGKVEYRKHVIDTDSGVGTQFQVCDLDGDGLLDVVTSNKKGVHVFLQRRNK